MKPRKSHRSSSKAGPRFTWSLAEDNPDLNRSPGVVAPASIARSLERGVDRGQLNLLLSLLPQHEVLGALTGRLGVVNDYAVEFSLHVRTGGRKAHTAWYRIVVARNDRDRGEIVKREIHNLQWAAKRLPKHVPTILSTGTVFQADRHGRGEHHRRLPAYVTKPLSDQSVLAFGNREQLATTGRLPRLLTRADTDRIRQRVIELCLRAHEPETRRALPPPELVRGALRIERTPRGKPEPYFASCTALWDRVDAVALFHRLVGFEWRHANEVLPLLPSEPGMLLDACVNALGKEAGLGLLSNYADAIESKRFPEHRRLTRDWLLRLLNE